MSPTNPSANAVAHFDLTGNGTITDTKVWIFDDNVMVGQVLAATGEQPTEAASGAVIAAGSLTSILPSSPKIGTHFFAVQNDGDPLTVAAPDGASIYLGTTETQSILSGGLGSTCMLIYSADGVWQGLFSGTWAAE